MADTAKTPNAKTAQPTQSANTLPPSIGFESAIEEDEIADAHKARMTQLTPKKKGIKTARLIPWFTAAASESWDNFFAEVRALTSPGGAWYRLDNEGVFEAIVAGEPTTKKVPYKVFAKHGASPAQFVASLSRAIGIVQNAEMKAKLAAAYGKPEVAVPAAQRGKERSFGSEVL